MPKNTMAPIAPPELPQTAKKPNTGSKSLFRLANKCSRWNMKHRKNAKDHVDPTRVTKCSLDTLIPELQLAIFGLLDDERDAINLALSCSSLYDVLVAQENTIVCRILINILPDDRSIVRAAFTLQCLKNFGRRIPSSLKMIGLMGAYRDLIITAAPPKRFFPVCSRLKKLRLRDLAEARKTHSGMSAYVTTMIQLYLNREVTDTRTGTVQRMWTPSKTKPTWSEMRRTMLAVYFYDMFNLIFEMPLDDGEPDLLTTAVRCGVDFLNLADPHEHEQIRCLLTNTTWSWLSVIILCLSICPEWDPMDVKSERRENVTADDNPQTWQWMERRRTDIARVKALGPHSPLDLEQPFISRWTLMRSFLPGHWMRAIPTMSGSIGKWEAAKWWHSHSIQMFDLVTDALYTPPQVRRNLHAWIRSRNSIRRRAKLPAYRFDLDADEDVHKRCVINPERNRDTEFIDVATGRAFLDADREK